MSWHDESAKLLLKLLHGFPRRRLREKIFFIVLIIAGLFLLLFSNHLERFSRSKQANQEMNNSPGATQIGGDQYNYFSIPQTETRPYLTIELRPGPNEYMRKDGNSQLFLICCHNNFFLVLPFKIKNVGKMHAAHIEAKYSSPGQQNVAIALGEKSNFLSSGDEIPETFRPHINISRIVQHEDDKEFNVELLLSYQKYDESDSTIYHSRLELVLAKTEVNGFPKAYKILKNNLTSRKK